MYEIISKKKKINFISIIDVKMRFLSYKCYIND